MTASKGRDALVGATDAVLLAFTALTGLATVVLSGLPSATDRAFAWTIQPPLTAAFLGAGYGAGLVLVVLSRRRARWSVARVGYHTVWVFSVLTLIATVAHLDRFHLASAALPARAAAWLWLAVYVVVPVAMPVAWMVQRRVTEARSGTRPRRLGRTLTTALSLQGAVLAAVGTGLFALEAVRAVWPWTLTPLTGQMIGAWLVSLGFAALLVTRTDDLDRLQVAAAAYVAFGALQLAALLRFYSTVVTSGSATLAYAGFLVSMIAVGVAGMRRVRTPTVLSADSRPAGGDDVDPRLRP